MSIRPPPSYDFPAIHIDFPQGTAHDASPSRRIGIRSGATFVGRTDEVHHEVLRIDAQIMGISYGSCGFSCFFHGFMKLGLTDW